MSAGSGSEADVHLLDHRLLFVTGKGGVGKTTVAAALALAAARSGKRTLVCEVDAKGNLAESLGRSAGAGREAALRFEPTEIQPSLFAMAMNTEESLKEYLSLQLRLPLLAKIGPLARTFDYLANAAPGVKEILTVGKLCWEVRARHYDLVVVDASATGHIVSQLSAPAAINELVQVGRVRDQTRWMLDILEDPASTGLVIVTSPEEMPVSETIELAGRVRTDTNVKLAAVVVNRVLPEPFGRGEEEVFESLRAPAAIEVLHGEVGPSATTVLDAVHLAVRLRRTRASHLGRLRDALYGPTGVAPEVVMAYVPELFGRLRGVRATAQVASALMEELG